MAVCLGRRGDSGNVTAADRDINPSLEIAWQPQQCDPKKKQSAFH